jgi:hypothetical protein
LVFNLADTALSVGTLAAGAAIGVQAAAASRLVYGLGWFLLYAIWLQRMIGFRWARAMRIYLSSGGVALATITPAVLAISLWRTPSTLSFSGLAASGIASGIAWLIGIVLFRHPARDDLSGMARHVIDPIFARFRMIVNT